MDYYNLLGIPPSAHPEDIRSAFRHLAKKDHPDAHPHLSGAEKLALQRRFIALAQAYETLSDPARRMAYDRQHRPAGPSRPTAGPTAGGRAQSTPRPQTAPPRRPAGQKRKRTPPPESADREELEQLLEEVQKLMGRFGMDLRQQFGNMLEKALDWALTVFMEVMVGLESGKDPHASATRPTQADAETKTETKTERKTGTAEPKEKTQPGLDLEVELAALKKQVRNTGQRGQGRAPSSASVEEALEQIKQKNKP